MEQLSRFIVKHRNAILLVAVLLLIPSIFGYLNTRVNYDLLSYLPKDTESMKAQDVLGDDFNLSSVDMLVVNGMPEKDVAKLKTQIEGIDGVDKVIWRDSVLDLSVPREAIPESIQDMLYSGDSTMLIITFREPTASDRTMNAIAQIKQYSQMDCWLAGFSAITEDTRDLVTTETPIYSAIAVALTDRDAVLGYAGYQEAHNPAGIPIRTAATHEAMRCGETLVLLTPEEIGLPKPAEESRIKAAIVEPLWVGNRVEGTLKFYYRNANKITETQRSIAHGFAQLLATQMAAVEIETQRKLATAMELKMLQTQINPNFLFNTINTIASFIRTDPMKARTLLREFAVFYRRTLEDSTDRIMLSREIEQTMRYFAREYDPEN